MAAMKISEAELDAAHIDHSFRDSCAHILVPLNKCRRETKFAPWKCTDLRHGYEKCQYDEYVQRVALMMAQKADSGKLGLPAWQKVEVPARSE
eukprot:a179382_244.p2 GENE.a179382_244~~a179382_244.p2  ORF type:complete len:108 (+),score=25.19 a179382_244:48-326(+)